MSTYTQENPFVHTGLTNGNTYYYRVNVTNASGTINGSPVSATPQPSGSATITHGTELTKSMVGLAGGGYTTSNLSSSSQSSSQFNGEVIEFKDFYSSSRTVFNINHNNVTIRYCRIRHGNGQNGIEVAGGLTGVVIEYCEFDGMNQILGNYGSTGLLGGTFTARRNYAYDTRIFTRGFSSNTQVIENWVERLNDDNGAHNNSMSYQGAGSGGVAFLRNRAEAGNSAGISFYASQGSINNCEMKDNLIVGVGKGYGMYGGYVHQYRGSNSGIKIEGNRFDGNFAWGTNAAVNLSQPGNTFTNNRWVGSSTDEPAKLGI